MAVKEAKKATEENPQLKKVMWTIQMSYWEDLEVTDFVQFKDKLSIHNGVRLKKHFLH